MIYTKAPRTSKADRIIGKWAPRQDWEKSNRPPKELRVRRKIDDLKHRHREKTTSFEYSLIAAEIDEFDFDFDGLYDLASAHQYGLLESECRKYASALRKIELAIATALKGYELPE